MSPLPIFGLLIHCTANDALIEIKFQSVYLQKR